MICHHCQRRFRLRAVQSDGLTYCSADCATEGADAAQDRPCDVCKQFHGEHCPGSLPRMKTRKLSQRIERLPDMLFALFVAIGAGSLVVSWGMYFMG